MIAHQWRRCRTLSLLAAVTSACGSSDSVAPSDAQACVSDADCSAGFECTDEGCAPLTTVQSLPGCTLTTAGSNCACTQSCESGSCVGQVCATVVTSGLESPTSIYVDSQHVYWTAEGAIQRSPRLGGAAQTLTTFAGSASAITGDATHVYWAGNTSPEGPGGAHSMAKAGGMSSVLASSPGAIADVAVHDNYLYWAEVDAGSTFINQSSKQAGVPVVPWGFGPGRPYRLAASSLALYWASPTSGRLFRRWHNSSEVHELSTGTYISDFDASEQAVAWVEYAGAYAANSFSPAAVSPRRLITVEDRECAAGPTTGVRGSEVVVDGQTMYWTGSWQTACGWRTSLYATSIDGSVHTTLADFWGWMTFDLAQDDAALYMLLRSEADAMILRVRKP